MAPESSETETFTDKVDDGSNTTTTTEIITDTVDTTTTPDVAAPVPPAPPEPPTTVAQPPAEPATSTQELPADQEVPSEGYATVSDVEAPHTIVDDAAAAEAAQAYQDAIGDGPPTGAEPVSDVDGTIVPQGAMPATGLYPESHDTIETASDEAIAAHNEGSSNRPTDVPESAGGTATW